MLALARSWLGSGVLSHVIHDARAGDPVRRDNVTVTVVVVAFATVAGYLGFLGWDQKKTRGTDGYLHGPYEPWQVVALVLLLAVIAAWSGWRNHAMPAAVCATVILTLCFSLDAASDSDSDGLWGVGAGLVAVGTLGGFLLIGGLASRVRNRASVTGQRGLAR